ncbi:hypothetical protein VT03_01185 [Planctomyces sp. SH-PL14]|nr:hypothetical protein VT03_01185 [Planctomyces sp. SH-PL14]
MFRILCRVVAAFLLSVPASTAVAQEDYKLFGKYASGAFTVRDREVRFGMLTYKGPLDTTASFNAVKHLSSTIGETRTGRR